MIFTVVKDPIPFLIIDDTYNKEEQTQIYQELDFLVDKLQGPDKTGTALLDGKKKNNKGVFLNNVFSDLNFSNIAKTNRKIFNKEIKEKLFECHYAYRLFNNTNFDNTLLSYYDNGGSYFSHYDETAITVITWFFKKNTYEAISLYIIIIKEQNSYNINSVITALLSYIYAIMN